MADQSTHQSKSSPQTAKPEVAPLPASENDTLSLMLLRTSTGTPTPPRKPDARHVLWLQRKIGNRATRRLLAGKQPAADMPLQRTPIEVIDDATITGTETLTGDLYMEGRGDDRRSREVAPHLRGIHPSDARQGYLGDCFTIASLAAVAQQNPQIIYDAIQDNGDGSFTVTLYYRRREEITGFVPLDRLLDSSYTLVPRPLRVTPEVLTATTARTMDVGGGVSATVHDPASLHVRPDDSTTSTDAEGHEERRVELWAIVMERAFGMYLSGSSDIRRQYLRLDAGGSTGGGDIALVLEALTGERSSVSGGLFDELTLDEIDTRFRQNQAIVVETSEMLDGSGSDPHAYYLSDVDVVRRTLTLSNPHGTDAHSLVRQIINYPDSRINRIVCNRALSPRPIPVSRTGEAL
jgi:hypothetical protein